MKLHSPRIYYRLLKKHLFGEQALWEPKVMREMRQVHGRYFVDIGANKGVYSLALSKHFWKVYACEPNPAFRGVLEEKAKGRNITVLPYAISDRDGKTELFFDDTPGKCDGSADTILPVFDYKPASKPEAAKITFQGKKSIPVETRSLDSMFHEQIDLVKIDVEGAEFLALQGASSLLRNGSIRRIVVELHNRDSKQALQQIMNGYRYCWRWLDPDHLYAESLIR